MKIDIEEEFPCGYRRHMILKFGLFSMGHYDYKDPVECPLHGKNCPKAKKAK